MNKETKGYENNLSIVGVDGDDAIARAGCQKHGIMCMFVCVCGLYGIVWVRHKHRSALRLLQSGRMEFFRVGHWASLQIGETWFVLFVVVQL